MDNKDLISVIIPTYNSEKFIVNSISSVLSQTDQNFEIIIIDNNSIDKTIHEVKKFNSKKIFIYYIKNNGNISKSRNLGINKSNGKWIAFLDSDDSWYNNKIEIFRHKMNNYDFICHSMYLFESGKIKKKFNFFGKKKKFSNNMIFENLIKDGNPIFNSSVVVKKDLLNKVGYICENQPSYSNDYYTWIRLSLITNNFFYEERYLGLYNKHTNNYSASSKSYNEYLKCVVQFKKKFSERLKQEVIGHYYYLKSKEKLNQNDLVLCNQYMFKSFSRSTFEKKIKILANILILIKQFLKSKFI